MSTQAAAAPNGNVVTRRDQLTGTEITASGELGQGGVAEREQAVVQARYLVAKRFPRDIEAFEERLLGACKDPDFAKAAWFRRPVGQKKDPITGEWKEEIAEGFSIRFAEEAIAAYGNLYPELMLIHDDAEKINFRATVTDLQTNVPYSTEITVRKRVERRKLKKGQEAIGTRTTSSGATVYIVEATDEEILSKQNNLRSKAIRNDGLRLIPAAIKAKCKRQIMETQTAEIKSDLAATVERMIAAFEVLGVKASALELYLGHKLDKVSVAEVIHLREIYTGIEDGETTWEQAMEARNPSGSAEGAEEVANTKAEKLRAEAAAAEKKTEPGEKAEASAEPAGDGQLPFADPNDDKPRRGPIGGSRK